jgi:hypothetical protein
MTERSLDSHGPVRRDHDAMKFGGWQRLNAEYAKQLGMETPSWLSQAVQST